MGVWPWSFKKQLAENERTEQDWKEMERRVEDLRAIVAILESNFEELSFRKGSEESKDKI